MAGTVTRDTQLLPITTSVQQGAAHVTGSSTALDGTTIQEPFVILLDEADPGRKVSPAGEATLQAVVAALGGTLSVRLAGSSSAALSNVAASITSATPLGINVARKGVQVINDTTTATLYLAYDVTASANHYSVKLVAQAQWEMPVLYTGPISFAWDSTEGGSFARVTELS